MSETLFDPTLKKRKKKQVAFSEDPLGADADPTKPAPTTIEDVATNGDAIDMGPKTVHEQMAQNERSVEGDEGDKTVKEEDEFKAMFGDLKKKKKKKDIPLDLPEDASGTSTPVVAGEDLDFSDLKKKKKSSKKVAFDMEAFEKELSQSKAKDADEEEADEGAALEKYDEAELGEDPFAHGDGAALDAGGEPWLGTDRDYTYAELLHRFYAQLHASNPALLSSSGKRYTIVPPQLLRESKKTVFANISDICKRMHRQPDHVIQYMFAEMGTTGSVDASGRLAIKGKFQPKQIEHVLRRYILEYVTCQTCKSLDTLLVKENRIYFMSCESCGSRRSVAPIKTGYQAQVSKRSRTKAQT